MRQDAVWLSFLAVLATGVCYYSVITGNHYVDSPHNGFFLKNAIDLLDGRVMFRDSFNSYGLLATLIHTVGIAIWGLRIPALLNVTLVFVVATGFGVYYLWSQVMPRWAACLTASLYFVWSYRIHLPWPNYYATCFALCVGMCLMMSARSAHRRSWLIASGLAAGLVFATRQTLAVPLVVLAGFYVTFVPDGGRDRRALRLIEVAAFLAAFLVSILPFFTYLWLQAALDDWWIQSVRLVPKWYTPFAQLGDDVPSRIAYFAKLMFGELWLLTAVAVAASLFVCVRVAPGVAAPGDRMLVLLAVLSLAMLSQMFPDEGLWRHVLALSVGFGWPVYLLHRLLSWRRFSPLFHRGPAFMRTSLIPATVLAVLLPVVVPKVRAIDAEVRQALSFEVDKELHFQYMIEPEVFQGMWLPREQASFYLAIYREIQAFRRHYPDGPVITTNGDVLPLTFVRSNDRFNPMFTVYPSIAWATITRNPASHMDEGQRQAALARGRQNHEFDSDTANVLAYPDYWAHYASFVRSRRPLIINAGQPVPGYLPLRTVVFNGAPGVVESQYYFWWTQFSDRPQSVIWAPETRSVIDERGPADIEHR